MFSSYTQQKFRYEHNFTSEIYNLKRWWWLKICVYKSQTKFSVNWEYHHRINLPLILSLWNCVASKITNTADLLSCVQTNIPKLTIEQKAIHDQIMKTVFYKIVFFFSQVIGIKKIKKAQDKVLQLLEDYIYIYKVGISI